MSSRVWDSRGGLQVTRNYFEAAGITLLAASSEDPEALRRSAVEFARDGGVIAFPLLTDPGLATFKALGGAADR